VASTSCSRISCRRRRARRSASRKICAA
jgi:hypothetical protein